MGDGWDVFLSYSWLDVELVTRVRRALEDAGLRVFRDVDVPAFDGITEHLTRALDSSKVLLAVYSPRYPTRYACQFELTRAFLAGQREGDPRDRVLVINTERDESHVQPLELADAGFISGYGGRIDLEKLVESVRAKVDKAAGVMGTPQRRPLSAGFVESQRFVGRYPALWQVHTALQAHKAWAVHKPVSAGVCVIKGFTGTGKSWLAQQYGFLFQDAYPGGVFWTDGGSVAAIRRTAREQLGLDLDGVAEDRVVPAVVTHLNERAQDVLWVFDDATPRLRIGSPYAHLLFTTQLVHGWDGMVVETEGLSDVEAQELFGHQWPRDAVSRLVSLCGGHPFVLAATAAGGRDAAEVQLDAVAGGVVDVLRAWVRTMSEPAREVLAAASVLAAAPFPAALLESAVEVAVGPALTALEQANLVQRSDRVGPARGVPTWRVHALVAEAVRLEIGDLDPYAVKLAEAVQGDAHARALADREAVPLRTRARLLRQVASECARRGDLLAAEEAATALLALRSEVDDLLTAARTALDAGQYASALDRAVKALAAAECDDNHRDAYRARFLVAQAHEHLGRYSDADAIFPDGTAPGWLPEDERHRVELARVTSRRLRGRVPEALDLVSVLVPVLPRNDVWAAAMVEQARLELSCTAVLKARKTTAEVLGTLLDRGAREHPLYLQALGLSAEAELQVALTERGLREQEWERAAQQIHALRQDHEQRLGEEHPLALRFAVLECRSLVHRGQPRAVLDLAAVVKPRVERVFGRHHELHHRVRHSEAQALMQQENHRSAAVVLEELLPVQVAMLGRHHLDSLTTRLDLGLAYLLTGRAAKGRPLVREAAVELRRQFGWTHEVGFRAWVTRLYGQLPGWVLRLLLVIVRVTDRRTSE